MVKLWKFFIRFGVSTKFFCDSWRRFTGEKEDGERLCLGLAGEKYWFYCSGNWMKDDRLIRKMGIWELCRALNAEGFLNVISFWFDFDDNDRVSGKKENVCERNEWDWAMGWIFQIVGLLMETVVQRDRKGLPELGTPRTQAHGIWVLFYWEGFISFERVEVNLYRMQFEDELTQIQLSVEMGA